MPRKAPRPKQEETAQIAAGALPAAALDGGFPEIDLPVRPPFPPMEAAAVDRIPEGPDWLYEPKWDGFRCLAFKSGGLVLLQSKSCQPLGRYFPEVVAAFAALPAKRFVLDGEMVIETSAGLDFDALLQRIHPAESRIRKLAEETPVRFHAFDLLVDARGRALTEQPLARRREALEQLFARLPDGTAEEGRIALSPATHEHATAEAWLAELGASGLDGIVAKRLDEPYASGERAMVKVKRQRTADCVVGGFRWAQGAWGKTVGSLLLGLYDGEGRLDHVGFSSSFTAAERRDLKPVLLPHFAPPGFTGRAPGRPSRWSRDRTTAWEPLAPVLVCEVRYDHFSGHRFRHGTKFLRWRPDKKPRACTLAQVDRPGRSLERSGLG